MMKRPDDTDRLLRYLEGTLPDAEAAQLARELNASPALREALEELRTTQALLQTTVARSAEQAARPFLADRVMRQVRATPVSTASLSDLFASLAGLFRPVAVASALVALVLASYNVYLARQYEVETSFSEALLALPPVTASAVYDLDLYDLDLYELQTPEQP